MKKIRIIAICIICILIGAFFTKNASKSVGEIYLALGDSISTGYGLEDPSKQGFVSLVAEEIGYTAENHAVNGSTADDVLKLLESGTLDEKIRDAKLITITCGGNDMMKVLYEESAELFNSVSEEKIQSNEVLGILSNTKDLRNRQMLVCIWEVLLGSENIVPLTENEAFKEALDFYGANLESIIKYIRTHNTDAEIVIPTQYNPYKLFSGILSVINKGIDGSVLKLNEVIKEHTTEVVVADVYTAFKNESIKLCNADAETMNLDFHPNADGHAVIAKSIIDTIAEKGTYFKDVSSDNPFFEAINFVKENKIFNGISKNEFAPDSFMTRAMLVTVLHRIEGEPKADENNFSDVGTDAYYYNAVMWAKEKGIVNGYSETAFSPDEGIKREQLAAIMLRYAKMKGKAPVGAWAIKLDYSDLAEVSDYAAEAVMYCTMKNMMRAKENNAFMPKANATRAEVALAIQKFIERNE